jgi:crotonobetainyl-CoA:carnitine CoA-transferase CaiB-like acyl-CoA transferase
MVSSRRKGGSHKHKKEDDKPALGGLRVLDLTHALAGPYCTLLLGDYGAAIYKLESPEEGDIGRKWGPPFVGDQSSYFLGQNRGKYSISINLKRREGVELCLRLIDKMDVLIENLRPGTLNRLGLGYGAVRQRNPRLIYCSISGYGQTGPRHKETAMDLIIQCASGLLSVTGTEAGEQVRCGYSVTDVTAGMFAAIGILTALRARDRTGHGQFVDVSMLDGMISAMSSVFLNYLGGGPSERPMGTAYPSIVPYRVFRAQDASFGVAVGSEKLWSAFCNAIDRRDLGSHPEFATNALRTKNRTFLEDTLARHFCQRRAAEWIHALGAAGVPCSLVQTLSQVVDDPQTAFREMFPSIHHPTAGTRRVVGCPVKLSETPGRPALPAPLLGQHTHQVLGDMLGLDAAAAAKLAAAGVISPREPLSGISSRPYQKLRSR